MSEQTLPTNDSRRTALALTAAAGVIGSAAVALPFILSFQPSERAKAAGAPVEVDIGDLKPGELRRVEWRGKPVWVLRRTPEMLATLKSTTPKLADPDSKRKDYPTPTWAQNEHRSLKPELLVVVGICSHLGCSPSDKFAAGPQPSLPDDWPGGWLCPCHGSTFDYSGRVYKNMPAPDNLEVPPYKYLTDTRLLIGESDAA